MNSKNLGRASLAILAAVAAFSLTACDLGGVRRDDDRIGRHEPPERWHDHDRGDWGRDHDRGRGHDHDRDRGGDHDRGGRDHDRGHERRDAAAVASVAATNARTTKALASFDETNAGKMFDGSK